MIGAGGGLFAAWLPDRGAQELFAPPEALVAGSGSPSGFAERVPEGYRVRGRVALRERRALCVGVHGRVRRHERRQPRARCRRTAAGAGDVDFTRGCAILDTWDATGMRATGSHDFEVREALVPEHHSFSVLTDAPRAPGPLYKLPFSVLTELPVSAVGLGIARNALKQFAQALPAQKSPGGGYAAVNTRFAQAQAVVELAAAAIAALAEEAWRTVSEGGALDATQLARITATCCVSQEQLRHAIGELASVAGMRAIDRGSAFSRAWRDLQTLGAHGSLAPQRLVAAGERLLKDRAATR